MNTAFLLMPAALIHFGCLQALFPRLRRGREVPQRGDVCRLGRALRGLRPWNLLVLLCCDEEAERPQVGKKRALSAGLLEKRFVPRVAPWAYRLSAPEGARHRQRRARQ